MNSINKEINKKAQILHDEKAYYKEAFMRNAGLLSEIEQEKLKNTTIAIAGVGGVGGIHAISFARLGIGSFHLADLDAFEVKNINRQMGAMMSTVGIAKVDAIEAMILDINPHAHIKKFPHGVLKENIDEFLENVDIVIDGIEFFLVNAHRTLHSGSRKHNLYVIMGGPIGFGSSVITFSPTGMSFDDYFAIKDDMDPVEMAKLFGLGHSPALIPPQFSYFEPKHIDFKKHLAPSLVIGTLSAANIVTTETVKLITGREKLRVAPESIQFDPFTEKYHLKKASRGNRGFIQRFKYWFIKRKWHI